MNFSELRTKIATTETSRVNKIVAEKPNPAENEPVESPKKNAPIPLPSIARPPGTAGILWNRVFGDDSPHPMADWARRLYANKGVISPETLKKMQEEKPLEIPQITNVIEQSGNGGVISPPIIEVFNRQHATFPVVQLDK